MQTAAEAYKKKKEKNNALIRLSDCRIGYRNRNVFSLCFIALMNEIMVDVIFHCLRELTQKKIFAA